ncbi:DEAD/DEAH box helicase [Azohydromonas sediminis]|uniref:DEAD/DEAH box helicase n=1 Tax=Azohydromonas sediminis TaxID=2259674 RepID=UPI001F24EC98|nr:DEAD/DEAH box helicase [Azohydromonas sediminis]
MSRRRSSLQFTNLHGQPLGGAGDVARTVRQAAEERRDDEVEASLTPAELERVFDALVIAGWRRGKTALTTLLRAMDWRRDAGRAFSGAETGGALRRLLAAGRVQAHEGEGWSVPEALAEVRLATLLVRVHAGDAWRALLWVANGALGTPDRVPVYFTPRDDGEAVALLRLVLISGVEPTAYAALARGPLHHVNKTQVVLRTLAQLLRLGLFERVDASLRWQLLAALDEYRLLAGEPALLAWVESRIGEAPAAGATGLRLRVAEQRLHRGDAAGMQRAVAEDADARPFLPLLQSVLPAREGRFAETAAAFPVAWKALCAFLGKRRGFAPPSLLQWYPLALMAQHDAAAWTTARKFCVALSGSRTPSPFDRWGRWAHVLAVRLGDARLDVEALQAGRHARQELRDPDALADRVVLAAWLGKSPPGWDAALVTALAQALHEAGLPWKADLVAQACENLGWPVPPRPAEAPPPWPAVFFAPRQDAWRDALAAIAALGEGRAATAAQPLTTLRWRLVLDDAGRVHDLQVFEPAATARGKPKPLTPLQLKKRTRLDPRDAAVARCLRQGRYRANEVSFDLVAATVALVGHPALELDDAPGVAVELVESLPALEVRRERSPGGGEHFVFQLHDELLADTEPDLEHHLPDYDQMDAEIERRNGLRVVRDAADRARLIRITPAQRRVAELVAQRWTVPVDAGAELDAALRVLAGHFVLQSDAAAGQPVASDARLVAQLQPRGDAMRLTLAVRPFGDHGPLLAPGHGRARLMTLHGGVSLATERDLDTERTHLAAVFERLPFLAGDEGHADASWLLEDPEQALAVVHEIGRMAAEGAAVRALEWPKGRPLRVHEPGAKAFATTLSTGRDWFALDGELRLDEQRVLTMQQLLALLREARGSRYVALGDGEYLVLADQLRQRLAELDALAETDGAALKVGATAAAWLAEAAPELGATGDAAWRRRAADLERAAALEPEPPHGLQATLRPYQYEGYAWMRRLAEAGFGAVLADDMGLGKTVQTLALLLARAAAGPALVVAPTSVCGNWADEAARFAPGLRCSVYGQGDRERAAQVEAAGAGDLLVISYALLLRDAEVLATKPWATLVLDEAQALKNAATQRVQAVGALQAGFRLALSGTPVENRLADLWSIMNLLNPGLLGSASRFAERFANPIERQRSEAARARLRRLVSPFLLRRTKAQVLADLPPRTEIVQRIEPAAEERAFLEAMRREALERIARLDPNDANRNRFNVLGELTRLRRAACDPRLAAPEVGRIGAKVQAFERLATELVDARHQALVFSQFTDFLKLLAERLDACGLRYQVLDGSTPAAARQERVAAFQRGEADLFLISLKAGGFGLNLTAADYVIIADPWWNPAAEDQAMGRAHRIGQQRPVTVYRLVTAGSIEERIVALHHDKRELAEGLLAGQDSGAPLAASELIDLLRDAG